MRMVRATGRYFICSFMLLSCTAYAIAIVITAIVIAKGGGVVRLVAREAQVVRVHVRRVVRGDRVARHHVLQDARLVEQLERADDREDHRDRERALQFGQLDGLDDLPFARPSIEAASYSECGIVDSEL